MWIVVRDGVIGRCIGIDHAERAHVAQCATAGGIGDEQERRGIAENVAQALARIRRIERDISASGLEDREQRDDRADAAFHAQRHAIFRTHTQRDQTMCKPVGSFVDLRERERLVIADERDRIGREPDLLLEALMNAQMLGIRGGRVVPAFQQGLSLGQHELERVQRRIGPVERLFEQTREAARMGIDGFGRIERRIAIEHQFDAEFIALVMHDQREIVGRAVKRAIRHDPAPGEIQRAAVLGHDVHGGTEERPVGFDASHIAPDVLHAIALVTQHAAALPRYGVEQGSDGRAFIHDRAQRQRIGRHARNVSRQSSDPRRDRQAEHDFGLAAQTRDIRGHDRRHDLRPGRAIALGHLTHASGRFRRQTHVRDRLRMRARLNRLVRHTFGEDHGLGAILQIIAPEALIVFERAGRAIGGVVVEQIGEASPAAGRGLAFLDQRRIHRCEALREKQERITIERNMVNALKEKEARRAGLKKLTIEERPVTEIESRGERCLHVAIDRFHRIGRIADIDYAEREIRGFVGHRLMRQAVRNEQAHAHALRFVDRLTQSGLKHLDIERSDDLRQLREVEARIAQIELLSKEDARLSGSEGKAEHGINPLRRARMRACPDNRWSRTSSPGIAEERHARWRAVPPGTDPCVFE
ncbi:hypothetical protein AWB74_04545 [Caballeronia arvi]|uniref:Uncharacterized protein n=1 Tax=Caballeronia arvi TaxID=1777135 RepID=A0A158JYA6_9BURK|nr:hypothetical protein AWB74_04545 [Caballeronia arvi]